MNSEPEFGERNWKQGALEYLVLFILMALAAVALIAQ